MKRAITFLILTTVMTAIIAGLFFVIVCAPEPWQNRPWTIWERCAQVLLIVLGWPIAATSTLLDRVGKSMPDSVTKPFIVLLFVVSGAFWAAIIKFARNRMRRTPNHTSEGIRQSADGSPKPSM